MNASLSATTPDETTWSLIDVFTNKGKKALLADPIIQARILELVGEIIDNATFVYKGTTHTIKSASAKMVELITLGNKNVKALYYASEEERLSFVNINTEGVCVVKPEQAEEFFALSEWLGTLEVNRQRGNDGIHGHAKNPLLK